jgi:hypothetical protein
LEFNETVCPDRVPRSQVIPQVVEGDIRTDEKDTGGGPEGAFMSGARDEGPNQIVLFFERDTPKRSDGKREKPMGVHVPVAGEEDVGEERRQRKHAGMKDYSCQHASTYEGKVKRPNSKDATDKERPNVNCPVVLVFSQQEFGDEVRAENKKQLETSSAGIGKVDNQGKMRNIFIWNGVVKKHHDECQESKEIEFRPIEAKLFSVRLSNGGMHSLECT